MLRNLNTDYFEVTCVWIWKLKKQFDINVYTLMTTYQSTIRHDFVLIGIMFDAAINK